MEQFMLRQVKLDLFGMDIIKDSFLTSKLNIIDNYIKHVLKG